MVLIRLPLMVKISSLFACFLLIHAVPDGTEHQAGLPNSTLPSLEIIKPNNTTSIQGNSTISLTCKITPKNQKQEVWWTKNGRNLTVLEINNSNFTAATMNIKIKSKEDIGNYTCVAKTAQGNSLEKPIDITSVLEPGRVAVHGARVNLNVSTVLSCWLEGYLLSNFKWEKIGGSDNIGEDLKSLTQISYNDETHVTMTLYFTNATREQNGTYQCSAVDHNSTFSSQCDFIVIEKPEVKIEFVKAIGTGSVYLNWTVNDHNDIVQKYFIEHTKIFSQKWESYSEVVNGSDTSYVLEGLDKGATYQFRISAINSAGTSPASGHSDWITTLKKDPEFIPKVSYLEKTYDSITLVWTCPPKDVQDYVHYYNILVSYGNQTETHRCPVASSNIYEIMNLEHGVTNYQFKVAACNNFTKECYPWSVDRI